MENLWIYSKAKLYNASNARSPSCP